MKNNKKLIIILTILIILVSLAVVWFNNQTINPSFNNLEKLESYLYKEKGANMIEKIDATSKIFYVLYYKNIRAISFVTVDNNDRYKIINYSQKVGLNSLNTEELAPQGSYGEKDIYIEYMYLDNNKEFSEEQIKEYNTINFNSLKLFYKIINQK